MWHHPNHMLSGKAAAAKSKKTPAHLIPHLQRQSMKSSMEAGRHAKGAPTGGVPLRAHGSMSEPAGNKLKTGATPTMKPKSQIGGGTTADDGSTQQAEEQIAAPPMPFQNPKAALFMGVGRGPTPHLGTGATKNKSGMPTSKAPFRPPLDSLQRKQKPHGARRTHSNFYGTH